MHPTLSATFYALGYLTAICAFAWLARRRRIATVGIFILMAAGLLGGLLGANVVQLLATGVPGKTVIGAVLCGYLSVMLAKRLLGIGRDTGDMFALAISAGEAVGRWGCFFAGCCYGKASPAGLPWAIRQHGALRHPTQVYESLANAAIFAVLLMILRRNPRDGMLFCVQGILFCLARFVIEFYRESSIFALHLSLAQWACIGGLLFFSARFWLLTHPRPSTAPVPASPRRTALAATASVRSSHE
jgi:phosphatidylglycerol:prolipoprotein diacylglycerol transferase